MKNLREENMEIFRNNQPIILTITGKNYNNSITDIIAYDNFGNQIFLNIKDESRAREILENQGSK